MNALQYIAATVEPQTRDWETTLASYYTWIANDIKRAGLRFHEYRDDFAGITKMELLSLSGSKSAVVVIGGDSVEIEFNVPGHGRTRDTYYKRYPSLHVFNRAAAQHAADAIKQFFQAAVTATVEPGQRSTMYNLIQDIREAPSSKLHAVSVHNKRLTMRGTALNHDNSVSVYFSALLHHTHLNIEVKAPVSGRPVILAVLSDAGGHLDDTEFEVPRGFHSTTDWESDFRKLLADAVEWGIDNA